MPSHRSLRVAEAIREVVSQAILFDLADPRVKAVTVLGKDAWFAGPVVDGNVGAGQWLFAKVHDGGEPAYLVDHVWGSFTDEATALKGVLDMSTPGDGLLPITSGNLQVQ